MKKKILTLTIGLTALAFAGCESTGNTNTTANSALRNANSNTAVVVNNNGNSTVVQTTNNSNRWANANNVNRADYDKNRADYERDRGNSKIGTGANDGWIWFKTRAALLSADDLRDSTIDVDVDNAVVTLRGTVASAAQKTKAEQTAKGIEGVTKVTNQLTVNADGSDTDNNNNRSNANANRR